jgi:hypothetical protein
MSFSPSDPLAYNLHLVLSLFARESRTPFPMRREVLMGLVHRYDPQAAALVDEVRKIQQRLGTADEQPEDLERVKVVAHRLGTVMCLAVLAQGKQDRAGSEALRTTPSIPLPAGTEVPWATV